MLRLIAALLLLGGVGSVKATTFYPMPDCAPEIARYYGVPLDLVGGIRHAEGGKVGQRVGPNRNGSWDLGPMQINTNWFNGTFDVDMRDFDIHEEDALHNECTNIAIGAWVLMTNYRSLNNWYEAVAAYNAGIKNRRVAYPYADRVFRWKNRVKDRWVPRKKPTVIRAEGLIN